MKVYHMTAGAVVVVLALALAGCGAVSLPNDADAGNGPLASAGNVPGGGVPVAVPLASPTPVPDVAGASATLEAARVALATAQAGVVAATAAAEQTAGAWAFGATATTSALDYAARAGDLTATAAARVGAATATAAAASVGATSAARSADATAAAAAVVLTAEARARDAAQVRGDAMAFVGLACVAGAVSLAMLAGVFVIVSGGRLMREFGYQQIHHQQVMTAIAGIAQTRDVTLAVGIRDDGGVDYQIIRQAEPLALPNGGVEFETEAQTVQAVPYRVMGKPAGVVYLQQSPGEIRARRAALKLLSDALVHHASENGGDTRAARAQSRVPGYRRMGWGAEQWTEVVASLKPALATRAGGGGGTVVCEYYGTLGELYDAVGRREITPGRVSLPGGANPAQSASPSPAGSGTP